MSVESVLVGREAPHRGESEDSVVMHVAYAYRDAVPRGARFCILTTKVSDHGVDHIRLVTRCVTVRVVTVGVTGEPCHPR